MRSFKETIAELLSVGYTEANIEEKLAQDIVLKAIISYPAAKNKRVAKTRPRSAH